MTECFTTENILLSNIFKDIVTRKIIRKINYKDGKNKLMIETPILIIDYIFLEKFDAYKRICVICHMAVDNNAFKDTILNIDNFCLEKISKGKEIYKHSYNSEKNQFIFYIPIYDNKLNVLIEDKNKNIVSIKSLNKGLGMKAIVLLSHLEVGNNDVFLNWNIIQIKLE
jgi:hypothetical protein